MCNARNKRLRAELPRDDAASRNLLSLCAACLVILLVGVAMFDLDAQALHRAPTSTWSRDSAATHGSSPFEAHRPRLALVRGRASGASPEAREAHEP